MKYINKILHTFLTVTLSSLVVAGVVYAGSLTAPSGTPTATSYTLADIYNRLVTNTGATLANHSLSTTTAPAASLYTLTQIYDAIPTIDPSKVVTGTTYLGVAGSATAGSPYASKILATGQTTCNGGSGGVASLVSCTGTNQDGELRKGTPRSYTDNGDGTISDNATGLTWQKCTRGLSGNDCTTGTASALQFDDTFGSQPANEYCDPLVLGGQSDWRVPNVNELLSIVDFGHIHPAIDQTYFPHTVLANYWTSTSFTGFLGGFIVEFDRGVMFGDDHESNAYLRCVRG